ncbi:MAG TPA: hypothetical protein DCY13_21360 [Verrucomicrobiales bacterium]|nr:hypothetical protein [Verrucomicrobiales bacterium]
MKHTGRLMNQLAVFGVAMITAFATSTGQAQSTQQGKAQVRAVHGSARYSTGGGAWMELKTGTVLTSGAVVSTATGSHVDLYLGINGPVVRVKEDTTLGIDKLTYTDTGADAVVETQLNLQKGTIMGSVRKLAAASRYEIKTPSGVAGIRGTDYVITHTMIVFIIKGLGHVAYILPDGNILSESVSSGEMFVPPGTKRPITKEEYDRYAPEIGQMIANITGTTTPVDRDRIFIFDEPLIGDRPVSPVNGENGDYDR